MTYEEISKLLVMIDEDIEKEPSESRVIIRAVLAEIDRRIEYAREKHQCSCDCPACGSCSYSD